MEHPSAAPIPAPAGFPVTWTEPGEEHLFWTHERMHFPDPMPSLTFSVASRLTQGFGRAAEAYEMPIRFGAKHVNTYYYQAVIPVMASPEELQAMGERSQQKLGAVMGRLSDYWATECLPEIKQHLAHWESFDLSAATTPSLLEHLKDALARHDRLWEIHFRVAFPFLLAMSLFDEIYRDLFGNESAFDAYRLLQGFENKTIETGRVLWELSRKALTMPDVRLIVEERSADEVIPALERSSDGRAFLADLRAYLDEYGQRGDKFGDLSYPSWIEDPTPVIKNLKDFIAQPDRDLVSEMAAQAAERERLVAAARERLKGYPQPVVGQFEFLLKAAQEASVLSEDHGFWIDFRGAYQMRRILLEFGRRLANAGVIEKRDDVFFLTLDELREATESLPRLDRRQLVATRKAEMEHFRKMAPPPALGTDHGPPPDNPVSRTIGKFFGGPPQPLPDPNVLRGNAGSPGIARGPARVIRSLAEASRLQKGDVLVAETTAPPWTPLFATAAAVITDTGGILSHCAVVAREYRIPAVVGTGGATATIRDGQIVEVDGNTGMVRIVS